MAASGMKLSSSGPVTSLSALVRILELTVPWVALLVSAEASIVVTTSSWKYRPVTSALPDMLILAARLLRLQIQTDQTGDVDFGVALVVHVGRELDGTGNRVTNGVDRHGADRGSLQPVGAVGVTTNVVASLRTQADVQVGGRLNCLPERSWKPSRRSPEWWTPWPHRHHRYRRSCRHRYPTAGWCWRYRR
jgi:hypothetical protein